MLNCNSLSIWFLLVLLAGLMPSNALGRGPFRFVSDRGYPNFVVDLVSSEQVPQLALHFSTDPEQLGNLRGCQHWSLGVAGSGAFRVSERELVFWTPRKEKIKMQMDRAETNVFQSKDQRFVAKVAGPRRINIIDELISVKYSLLDGRLDHMETGDDIFHFGYLKIDGESEISEISSDRGGRLFVFQYDNRGFLKSIEQGGRRVAVLEYKELPRMALVEGHIIPVSRAWTLDAVRMIDSRDGAILKQNRFRYALEDSGWKLERAVVPAIENGDNLLSVCWDIHTGTVTAINENSYLVESGKSEFSVSRFRDGDEVEKYVLDRKTFVVRRSSLGKQVTASLIGSPGHSYGKPRSVVIEDTLNRTVTKRTNHYDSEGKLRFVKDAESITQMIYSKGELIGELTRPMTGK